MLQREGLRFVSPFRHTRHEDVIDQTNPRISFDGSLFGLRKFFRFPPRFIIKSDPEAPFPRLLNTIYTYSIPYTLTFDDVFLCGYRSFIKDNMVYLDFNFRDEERRQTFIEKLRDPDPFEREDMNLEIQPQKSEISISYDDKNIVDIEKPCIVLSSTEPSNYGSFLFRVLTKLASLNRDSIANMPVLSPIINRNTRELLEIFGVNSSNIIRHDTKLLYRMKRAVVPSIRCEEGFLDHEAVALFSRIRREYETRVTNRRLYISRDKLNKELEVPYREMINEEQVIDFMSRRGFEILDPRDLSSADVIRKFAEASIVVGPSGGGLFNCAFCQPGTKVIDIESEANWLWTHSGFFASLQLDYGIVVGRIDPSDRRTVHKRWTLDLRALEDGLRSFHGPY